MLGASGVALLNLAQALLIDAGKKRRKWQAKNGT
jgi:hypothetical protein